MTIDLSELFQNNVQYNRIADKTDAMVAESYTVAIDMDSFQSRLGTYSIVEKAPIDLKVTVCGRNKAHIEGGVSLVMAIPCDRCLDLVDRTVEFWIDRDVDFDSENHEDDISFAEGYIIDIDKMLYSEILMALPMKNLCSEDCKGFCRKCGINLNRETCGCDTFVPDPRMSVISDIFKKFSK